MRETETLADFMVGMIGKLVENGHKPGWLEDSLGELYTGLEREVGELREDVGDVAVAQGYGTEDEEREALQRALRETYDVGNFAYFIADKIRVRLEELQTREEKLANESL